MLLKVEGRLREPSALQVALNRVVLTRMVNSALLWPMLNIFMLGMPGLAPSDSPTTRWIWPILFWAIHV